MKPSYLNKAQYHFVIVQCRRCHHTDEAHKPSDNSNSMLKLGACQIPDCTCREYLDSIKEIDEELL